MARFFSRKRNTDTARSPSGHAEPIEVKDEIEMVVRPVSSNYEEPELADEKPVLTEEQAYHVLGFAFPTWKKWLILTSVFIAQVSMNFNVGIYPNALSGMEKEFGISTFTGHVGAFLFLISYAFGCELWAPFSEELGRKWILQGSLFLVNIWQLPCIFAPNFATIMVARALGGLSSAGGSVTLGMVADMWEPLKQQQAVNFVVFASCGGSVLGPIVGGFVETYLSWKWVFIVQLLLGIFAQILHAFVPETCAIVLLDKEAKRRRDSGEDTNIYGPDEVRGTIWQRMTWKETRGILWRPYKFLLTEPIVGFLSLLSGFSDALIFTGLDSVGMVMKQWDFNTWKIGLCFIALLLGYLVATLIFCGVYRHDAGVIRKNPANYPPESRLKVLLVLVVFEPVGLFLLAWTSLGPNSNVPWIAPLIAMFLIGLANLAIYQATIDYMIAAYGPRSASATGGNGFCRDALAGFAALYSKPFYNNIAKGTKWRLPIPTFILCGISIFLVIPVYVFYVHGPWFRQRSPYASDLEQKREQKKEVRDEAIRRSEPNTPVNSPPQSRQGSTEISRAGVQHV